MVAEFRRSAALPQVEARRSRQERDCYRPHAHDDFSLGVIEAGSSVVTGSPDGPLRLAAGDVITIPAGRVHACNPDTGPWHYQMIHLDQEWAASLAPPAASSELFAAIRVVRRPEVAALARGLAEAIFAGADREATEARAAALFAELARATPAHLVAGEPDAELLGRLAPVLRRLRSDRANPALGALADSIGMTPYQLIRAVRRATGLTPLAWRQNARILQARRMLRDGRPIAETAHELGFVDQSHFHRVFRAHVATSPGSYRG
ncbi:AraC family transcriptional regulator [Naumannella huperziae]